MNWTPNVTYEELRNIVDTMGADKFVEVTKQALHSQTYIALKNVALAGINIHPHNIIFQSGHDIVMNCYIPPEIRAKSGNPRLWTEPLVLFHGEALDMKDPAGNWHFEDKLTREVFNEWIMEETRELDVVTVRIDTLAY